MVTDRIKKWGIEVRDDLRPNDKVDYFTLMSSLALFIYTITFSLLSDLTSDEAFTYINYSTKENPLFLSFHFANNHPLNSFLIYITSFLFPYKDFFIRLPNILFLIIYLIYAIKISKTKKNSHSKLLVFSFLAFYYFLTPTFFSQARGYGIAAALVLIFLFRFSKGEQDFKKIITNFYILLLATSAFTGLIPLVLAVAVYYVFFELKLKVFKFIKDSIFDILILLIGFSWLLYNLIEVSASGKPLYGSESGFLQSTIGFYLNSFLNLSPEIENETFFVICTTIFLMIFTFFLFKKSKETRVSFIFALTFLIFYLSSIISERPHITGRLLLPLFPLVVLSLFELLGLIRSELKVKKAIFNVVQVMLGCLIFMNFIFKSYKTNPKIVRGSYQEKIFDDLNFRVKHAGCCSSIPFYLEKVKTYPPINKIKSDTSFTEIEFTKEMKGYYSFEKGALLLEASDSSDVETRFLFHIHPKDIKALSANRRQYGFDNKDFSWNEKNGNYQLIIFPDYEIKFFKVGQFNKNGPKWKNSIINKQD